MGIWSFSCYILISMFTIQQNTNKYKQKVWASQSTFFLPFQWTPYIFTDWRCWTSPEDVKDWLLWWVNNSKSALESLYQPVSYISTWITGTGRRENINCKRSNLDTPKRATAKEHIIYNYTIWNMQYTQYMYIQQSSSRPCALPTQQTSTRV